MKARMFFAVYSTVIALAVATCLCVDVYTKGPLMLDRCMFYQVSGQGYIYLYVRNTGGTRVQVTDVLMNGTSALPTSFERPWINAWEPGFVPCTYNWSSGQKYNIAFITSAGVFSFTETASALLEIENVTWNSENNTTSITVKNTSKYTGKVTWLGIFTQAGNMTSDVVSTDLGTGKTIGPNQTVTIVLNWTNSYQYSWTSGETYLFKVYADFGAYIEFNSTAPERNTVRVFKLNLNFYTQNSTQMIDIYVGNSGTSDAQITQACVGSSLLSLQNQTTVQPLPITLAAGQTVGVTVSYDWARGATYYFKVVFSTGQFLEWPEQAPA